MRSVPTLHHKLPHRTAGSFGGSLAGRAAEWLTTSWLRFESGLMWALIVWVTMATPWPNFIIRLAVLLMSPLAAVFLLFSLKGAAWVIYLVPISLFGQTLGWGRIAFLRTFSRLVVEPAPDVEMPLWIGR